MISATSTIHFRPRPSVSALLNSEISKNLHCKCVGAKKCSYELNFQTYILELLWSFITIMMLVAVKELRAFLQSLSCPYQSWNLVGLQSVQPAVCFPEAHGNLFDHYAPEYHIWLFNCYLPLLQSLKRSRSMVLLTAPCFFSWIKCQYRSLQCTTTKCCK